MLLFHINNQSSNANIKVCVCLSVRHTLCNLWRSLFVCLYICHINKQSSNANIELCVCLFVCLSVCHTLRNLWRSPFCLLVHLSHPSLSSLQLVKVSIMRDDPRQRGRNWQAPLEVRMDSVECGPGYQPSHSIGLFPNVTVTALAIAKQQHLIGVGCVYGFAIVDYLKNTIIHVHCTYDQSWLSFPLSMFTAMLLPLVHATTIYHPCSLHV